MTRRRSGSAALVDAAAGGAGIALASLSHPAYRGGAVPDMASITRMVHDTGALMPSDLCHAAGAVQVELDASGADLATGCTFKYLNAGPGSPRFSTCAVSYRTSYGSGYGADSGRADRLRLGIAPITARYVDMRDAMDRLRQIVAGKTHAGLTAGP